MCASIALQRNYSNAMPRFSFLARAHMAYTAILKRIRLLIPAKLDGHYSAIRRGFEEGDLPADMQLARAISEFDEASIATVEKRLNPQY
jgi:hypothetical protein